MGLTPFVRGPEWFFGLDAVFEGLELVTALLLAVFAYKCYKLSDDSRYSTFSLAFASLTLGTGIRAATDCLIHSGAMRIFSFLSFADIDDAKELFVVGYSAHVFFILLGLIILLSIALRINTLPAFLFILLSTIPLVFLSGSMYLTFHGLALLMALFVAGSQYGNWRQKPSLLSFLVFAGFVFIALAYLQFIIDLFFHMFYVKAHLTMLLGYLCLLATFFCTIRHGKVCKPVTASERTSPSSPAQVSPSLSSHAAQPPLRQAPVKRRKRARAVPGQP